MRTGNLKKWIELFIIGLAAALSIIISQITASVIKIYIFMSMGFLLILYSLAQVMLLIKHSHQNARATNNYNLIKMSKKHCKSLSRFAWANRRRLVRLKAINVIKQDRREENKILNILSDKNLDVKKRELLSHKLNKLKENLSNKAAVNLIKSVPKQKDVLISSLIVDTFIKLEKLLLYTEQYDLRIKFGKYIIDFSDKELNRQKAIIDFLGWTYLMMGKHLKGEEAINLGIQSAKYAYENSIDIKTKQMSLYNIARAYRHIGILRYNYEHSPEKSLANLNQADEYFSKLKRDEFPLENREMFDELYVEIKYGLSVVFLSIFKTKLNRHQQTDEDYKLFEINFNNLKEIIKLSSKFKNKKCFMKIEVLKSQYLGLLIDYYDLFQPFAETSFKMDKITALNKMSIALNNINQVFETNIFSDETIELYLKQSIKELKYNLIISLQGEL